MFVRAEASVAPAPPKRVAVAHGNLRDLPSRALNIDEAFGGVICVIYLVEKFGVQSLSLVAYGRALSDGTKS